MAQKIRLKKSNVVDKTPVATSVDFGELAINYASGTGKAFLATKKYDGTIAKFHEDAYNDGKYAEKSEISNINSKLSSFALSATVKNQISALTQTIEDDEYVLATALSSIDERIGDIEVTISGISGEYLTITSATSVFNTINSNVSTTTQKANSAYNYTNAVSATVKNGYWTSATTQTKIKEAKDAAVTSAYTASTAYTNNNYVAKTTYNSFTGTTSSDIDGLKTKVNTVSGNVGTLSGNVVSYIDNKLSTVYVYKGSVANFANLPESGKVTGYVYNVTNANGNIPAGTNYAWNGSAWDPLGGTVDLSWVASSGSVSEIGSKVSNLTTGLSAWTVTNAATHTEVGNASSNTLTSAATSATSIATAKANAAAQSALTRANAYTDTKTSGIAGIQSDVSTLQNNLSGLSAWTKTSAATHSEVGTASANSITSAKTYTNTRINATSGLLVTHAYFGSYSSATENKINNVNTALTAFSATVIDNYATEAEASGYAAAALGNAMDYTDSKISGLSIGNYLTKESAGTMYSNITSMFSDYTKTGVMNTQIANASARSVNSAVTYVNGQIAAASARTFDSGKTYADATFLMKASAGTMYSNVTSMFSDYTKTTAMNTQIANASARSVNSAVTYVDGQVGAASARTFSSGKTYADATFLTKASAGTMYSNVTSMINEISSDLSAYALSSTVKTALYNLEDAVEENEEVTSAALVELDNRMVAVSGNFSNYLTVESANTAISNVNNTASTALQRANSAYNYTNAVSATVKSTYWTSATTQTKIKEAKDAGVTSAYTASTAYTSNGYVAKSTYNTYTGNTSNTIDGLGTKINTVSGNVGTLSGNVVSYIDSKLVAVYVYQGSVTNYSNLPATGQVKGYVYNVVNANGNTPAGTNYAWNGSAWDALGGSIDLSWAASSGAVSDISSKVSNLTTGLSAWTVTNAATHTEVGNASSHTLTSAATSATSIATVKANAAAQSALTRANAYTDTKTSGIADIQSDISILKDSAATLNNKFSNYATHDEVKTASGNSVTSAKTYTNTRINATSGLLVTHTYFGSYSSATENKISNVNTALTAFSATVMTDYATKTDASTYASAALGNSMAYTDSKVSGLSIGDYLTRASAGTMYNNLTNADSALSNRINILSGTVSGSYATKAVASEYAAAAESNVKGTSSSNSSTTTVYGAKAYADTKDKILSGNVVAAISSVESKFSDYSKTSVMNTQIANASARSVNSAVTYVNGQIAAASARTFDSGKTYADMTFLTKASAGTMYDAVNNTATAAKTAANSAFNYTNAVSATVKSTYWTSATTQTKIKEAKDAAVTSAYTASTAYTNGSFFTKASAGTMYSTLSNDISKVNTALTAFSATVIDNYATEAAASEYAAAALGNAMDYTDSKISGLSIGDYLTRASAGTMYNNLTNADSNIGKRIDTLSGTVSGSYATKVAASGYAMNAETNVKGNSSSTSATTTIEGAKKYADTKVKQLSGAVVTQITNLSNADDGLSARINILSGTVSGSYVTTTTNQTVSGVKTFTGGIQLNTANSFTNSERSIPFGADGVPTKIQWVSTGAATGLTFNPNTGKLKVGSSGGYVINGKTANDLLNAAGGTTSKWDFASSAVVSNISSEVNTLSGGVISDYMLKKSYVASGTTAGRWEVNIPYITEYYDGLTIHVRLGSSYGSPSVLNVNGLGNAFVFWRRGSILTSHFPQWAEVTLVYRNDAGAGGYVSTINYSTDIVSGTTYKVGWVAEYAYYTGDGDARTTEIYERRYAGSRLTRYQIIAIDKDERLQPLTKVDSATYDTGTTKPVNTVGFRPERFFYRNTTGVTAAGGVETAQIDADSFYFTGSRYTFNSDLAAYRAVYLRGSYNADENLFYLNTGLTTFYTQVPTNTANLVLSDYFVQGDYYIYLGATYSSVNYFQLTDTHELFYFDGVNLVKHSKQYTDQKISNVNSNVQGALTAAQSAFNYTNAVSATVKNTYWISATTKQKIDAAVTSAYTASTAYTNANYVTKTIYSAFTGNVTSSLSNVSGAALSVSGAVKTLSGDVVTFVNGKLSNVYIYKGSVANFANLPESGKVNGYVYNVTNANGNTPAGTNYAWNGSAWDALGGTIDLSWVASSGSVSNVSSKVSKLTTELSAWTVTNAATHNEVKTASGNAITSANGYTNTRINATSGLLVTHTYFGPYSSATENKINNVNTALTAFSATVVNNYATEGEASEYAAAALGNAMTYTDSKISGIGIGNYLTKASAGTMYDTLNNAAAAARTAANSAFNYTNAVSATVKNAYWISATTQNKIKEAKDAGVTSAYTASTAYTSNGYVAKSTYNTFTGNVTSNVSNIANSLSAFSATVISNYATEAEASSYAAAALSNAVDYVDSKSVTIDGTAVSLGGSITTKNVTQTGNATNTNRPILMGNNTGSTATATTLTATTTAGTYTTTKASINPSTGVITAGGFALTASSTNLLTANGGSVAQSTFSTTDKKAEQTQSNTSYYKPLLMGADEKAAYGSFTSKTGGTFYNPTIYARPSLGEIGANQYNVAQKVTMQYNSTTDSLDFVFPE